MGNLWLPCGQCPWAEGKLLPWQPLGPAGAGRHTLAIGGGPSLWLGGLGAKSNCGVPLGVGRGASKFETTEWSVAKVAAVSQAQRTLGSTGHAPQGMLHRQPISQSH